MTKNPLGVYYPILPAPIKEEDFLRADKRALTRTEYICLELFVHEGGLGWGNALTVQDTLWDTIHTGIINHLQNALNKMGWDSNRYLSRVNK